MCIKNGQQIIVMKTDQLSLKAQLLEIGIPGDVIVVNEPSFDQYFLYLDKDQLATFTQFGVIAVSLSQALGKSPMATIWRCCEVQTCQCRVESLLRAKNEIEGRTNLFSSGSYQLLRKNCESFCFYCVHQKSITLRGLKGINYGIVPAKASSSGAVAGAGIGLSVGLLGGPLAPISVPVGVALGAAVGAGAGLLISLTSGAVSHIQEWSELNCFCSEKTTDRHKSIVVLTNANKLVLESVEREKHKLKNPIKLYLNKMFNWKVVNTNSLTI